MNLTRIIAPLAAATCLAACSPSGPRDIAQREADAPTLAAQPGQALDYQIQVMQTSSQQALGAEQESGTLTVLDVRLTAQQAGPNGSEWDVHFLRTRYAMMNGNDNLRFDSQDSLPPDSIPLPLTPYANAVGKHVRLRVNPTGLVDTVLGADELVAAMLQALGNVPAPQQQMVRQAVEAQFGSTSLARWLQNCFVPLPPHAPTPGAQPWHSTLNLPGLLPISTQAQYSLGPDSASLRRVLLTGTVATDTAKVVEMSGMRFRLLLTGTYGGTLWAQPDSWALHSAQTVQRLRGKLVTEQGMAVGLDTEVEITVLRLPAPAN